MSNFPSGYGPAGNFFKWQGGKMAADFIKLISTVALLLVAGNVSAHGLMSVHSAHQMLESPTFGLSLTLAIYISYLILKCAPQREG
jgi:hypothetical protein